MTTVLFAHGLEGHPQGRKPTAMRAAGLEVIAPDGRQQPLAARYQLLVEALQKLDRPIAVGSSYGGLAMLALARDHGDRLGGLVLCAPALTWNENPAGDPEALVAPPGTIVIHGTGDDVIPIEVSRRLVARSPGAVLWERDDGHRLEQSLDAIVAAVEQVASSPQRQ